MVNLHGRDPLMGMVAGNIVVSGASTNVVGGPMTAGTFDADGSGLLTFAAFKQVPIVVGTVINGGDTTTSVGGYLTFTGVTVSNAYLRMGPTPESACTVAVQITGLRQI